jgi:hypothetical protein
VKNLLARAHADIERFVLHYYGNPRPASDPGFINPNTGLTRKETSHYNWQKLHDHMKLGHLRDKTKRFARVGKAMDTGLKYEKLTKKHMVGIHAQLMLNLWKMYGLPLAIPFNPWLDHLVLPELVVDPEMKYIKHCIGTALDVQSKRDIVNKMVTYLSPTERKKYVIKIENGVVYEADGKTRFHTGKKRTDSRGKGWAIFVVSMDNVFYSHSHKTGYFHHSSFLSGGVVQSAGEISVNHGSVVAITNKTGHYMADTAMLTRALFLLYLNGVDMNNVTVNIQPGDKKKWYNGLTALKNCCEMGKTKTCQAPTLPT